GRERLPGRRVDHPGGAAGELAGDFLPRGNIDDAGRAPLKNVLFVGEKEVGFLLPDRPADGSAEDVELSRRPAAREERSGVERVVAEKFIQFSMKLVCA